MNTESRADRKQAIREWKERKPDAGVYAVRCLPTGRVWVGAFPNLSATRNSTFFSLRNGSHRAAALQAEWNAHQEADFSFEVLETLPDDTHPTAVHDLLKESRAAWIARLNAQPIL
jgi:hypothetical protein